MPKIYEGNAFRRLKERLCRPADRFERIENGLLEGMPDVNYVLDRQEGWIELKTPIEPKRDSTALFASNHPVSIEQANWMLRQHRAGGLAHLVIFSDRRVMAINGSVVGRLGAKINTLTAAQLERISAWRATHELLDPVLWLGLRAALTKRP